MLAVPAETTACKHAGYTKSVFVMTSDLEKLRIDKSARASRDVKPVWPKVLVVLLILAISAGLWSWRSVSAQPVVQTIRVRVPETTGGDNAQVALNATGYIIAAHKIELASKVIGRVAWVGVEMGDKIEKGQELVRLEDDEYRARAVQQLGILENAKARLAELEAGSRPQEIKQAEADLAQAKAELANAESSYNRLKELGQTSSVSQKEVEDALLIVRSKAAQVDSQEQKLDLVRVGPRKEQIAAQRATVRQLEGALELATIDVSNTTIRAPIPATVLERNVEIGEFVTTGFVGDRGAKGYVVSIADLNDLQVELDVSQNDFAKVFPQQPCWIVTDAYPDKRYDGFVDLISPEANRQKATVQVRVKVKNPDELLKPDMNATVSFLAKDNPTTKPGEAAARAVIRIPAGAVRNGAVFVVENGQAMRRTVVIGSTRSGEIEIRDGLIGGEDLIVSPPENLETGDAVKRQP